MGSSKALIGFTWQEVLMMIKTSSDLKEICKPLFDRTEITFFEYVKLSNQNILQWSSTNPPRTQLFINNVTNDSLSAVMRWIQCGNFFCYFWDSALNDIKEVASRKMIENVLSISSSEFGLGNGFVILEKSEKSTSVYSFCAPVKNEVMSQFYVNNLDLLQSFIFSFKEKTKNLLKDFESFELQGKNIDVLKNPDAFFEKNKFLKKDMDFNVKRFYLDSSFSQNMYLTLQEIKSLLLISKGCSVKEAAALLCLSARTVETYFKNAKERLNLKTNNQLIRLFWSSSLAKLA